MEVIILKSMNFQIHLPTVATTIDYLLEGAISIQDCEIEEMSVLKKELRKYVDKVLNKTLDIAFLRQFRPSCIAATLIVAGRISLELSPMPPHFMLLSGYSFEEIKDVMPIILKLVHLSLISK